MGWSMCSRCVCHLFGVLTFMGGFGSLISGVVWLAFYGDDVSQFTQAEFDGIVLVVAGVIIILWFSMYVCFVKRRNWMLFACCEYENIMLPALLAKQTRKTQSPAHTLDGAQQARCMTPGGSTCNILPPSVDYTYSPPPSSRGGTISITEFYSPTRRISDVEALERARAEIRMQVYNSANIYAIPVKGPLRQNSYSDDTF